jgi:hypothetical protein
VTRRSLENRERRLWSDGRLDVTPRAINEMRKRGVLPAPSTAYPVAWTDRKVLAAALREVGVLGQFVAIQIERGAL